MRETRSAFIGLDSAGCVVVRCKNIEQTVDHVCENLATSPAVSSGTRMHALLVDISKRRAAGV